MKSILVLYLAVQTVLRERMNKEFFHMAFNEADCRLEAMDPLASLYCTIFDRSGGLPSGFPVKEFPNVFAIVFA